MKTATSSAKGINGQGTNGHPKAGLLAGTALRSQKPRKAATSGKRKSTSVDKHIGGRVRMRREELGMSQKKLGNAIGVEYQQIQKYELGNNRLPISRLLQIGLALKDTPITFFTEGATDLLKPAAGTQGDKKPTT